MVGSAHQEEDGGIHVEVFEIEAKQAEGLSEGPGVGEVVVDPERQREDMGQVCQGQVNHEDHCLGLLSVGLEREGRSLR